MALYLHRICFEGSPFHSFNDAILRIPEESALVIRNKKEIKIIYLLSGSTLLSLDGATSVLLQPGDTFVINGSCTQAYRSPDREHPSFHALIVQFSANDTSRAAGEVERWFASSIAGFFQESCRLPTRHSALLWEVATRLREECETQRPFYQEVVHLLLLEFCLCLAEIAGLLPRRYPGPGEEQLHLAFSEMTRQIASRSTRASATPVPTLPAAPGLDRVARELLGIGIADFYRKIQIETAKLLLVSSRYSISAIARKVGFRSESTFYRQFQKETGTSTGHYKNQYHSPSRRNHHPVPTFTPAYAATPGWRLMAPSAPTGLSLETPGAILLLKGKLTLHLPGQSLPLEVARPFVVPSPATLRVEAENALLAFITIPEVRGKRPFALPLIPPARIAALEAALQAVADQPSTRLALCSQLGLIRLAALRQSSGPPPKPEPESALQRLPVAQAQEYITKNFRRSLTLNEIAWAVGVSEEHLSRQFQAVCAKTVMNYLKERRLTESKHLMADTRLPLEEIAARSGFSSTGLFFRAFKAREGCTPGSYRRRHEPQQDDG